MQPTQPPPTPPSPPPGHCHHHHAESWLDIDSVCRFDTRSPTLLVPNSQSKLNLTSLTTHLPISLSLKNQGSVARDHLASERTFLAYVRTSLAIASTGVGTSFSVCLFIASPPSSSRSAVYTLNREYKRCSPTTPNVCTSSWINDNHTRDRRSHPRCVCTT